MLRVAWYGVVVVAGDGVNNKYMEPIKLWIVQHATITRDASPRREFDGINWDLGSGIVENARAARGPWKRLYSHFARLGAGIGWRGGGGASAVGTTNFNKADGSGDVSSENEYTNVMFWYLFLGKDTETQGQ